MLVLRESPWYQEILQEGIQKGVQQGLERGLEQGLERGLERGLEQGVEQGQLKLLLRLLEHELGPIPAELTERIRRLSAELQLALSDQLFDLQTVDDLTDAVTQLEM